MGFTNRSGGLDASGAGTFTSLAATIPTVVGGGVLWVSVHSQGSTAVTPTITMFEPAQRITVAGTPTTDLSSYEYGLRVQFVRAGRITKIRYYRRAATSATVTCRMWNSGGTLLGTATDSTAGVGYQHATFATPIAVTAGTTYTFSYSPNIPVLGGAQAVTDTADCLKQTGYFVPTRPAVVPQHRGGVHPLRGTRLPAGQPRRRSPPCGRRRSAAGPIRTDRLLLAELPVGHRRGHQLRLGVGGVGGGVVR